MKLKAAIFKAMFERLVVNAVMIHESEKDRKVVVLQDKSTSSFPFKAVSTYAI